MRAVHCHVHGRVQGVGYRWSCAEAATRAGVAGWVRNLANGQVEVWAEGDDVAVEQLLAWCRQGPRWADVDEVEVRPAQPKGYSAFDVR